MPITDDRARVRRHPLWPGMARPGRLVARFGALAAGVTLTTASAIGQDAGPSGSGADASGGVQAASVREVDVQAGEAGGMVEIHMLHTVVGAESIAIDLIEGASSGGFGRSPGPGQVRSLLQPEFIRRDLPELVDTLALDDDQTAIAESLLTDYDEAFALASEPLKDALTRYWSQRSDRSLARMLDGANEEGGMGEVSAGSVLISGASIAGGGAEGAFVLVAQTPRSDSSAPVDVTEEVAEVVDAAATDVARPLQSLLDRVKARLEAAERAGEIVTATELVRLARTLRAERQLLRTEFTDLLRLISEAEPTEAGEARMTALAEHLRIQRELASGRLGGESMDLDAAIAATATSLGASDLLMGGRPSLAAALAIRAEATLDAEIAGLETLVARERRAEKLQRAAERGEEFAPPTEPEPEVRRFAAASRRQLDASVAVRDLVLAGRDAVEGMLAEQDPVIAQAFLDEAHRRGFRSQMRSRWSERALDHADSISELDETVIAALGGIRSELDLAARELREASIADRIDTEPKTARERIDAMLQSRDARQATFIEERVISRATGSADPWRQLDERITERLRAILSPEQFETLPGRRRILRIGDGEFSVNFSPPTKDE